VSFEPILKEINGVVGVSGSFLCDEEGAVVASDMPVAYSHEQLAAVGRLLAQTVAGLALARRKKVKDIDLVFGTGRLVAKNTVKGCLCILGAPDLNVPFLNLTADLAIRDLKHAAKEAPQAAQVEPAAPLEVPLAQAAPAEPAEAVPAPEAAPRPAIHVLIDFLELLLTHLEEHGIGRQDLLKILSHRIRRLNAVYPFLSTLVTPDGQLDPASLPLDSPDQRGMAEGLVAVIHGLCFSLRGIMGEAKAEAAYAGVYDEYYVNHRAEFVSLGLGDRLRKIVQEPLPSAHAGVDIHLD